MRLVPKFLSRRRKRKESEADEVGLEDGDDEVIADDERIEVRTERVRDAGEPIELRIDVPEEETAKQGDAPQAGGEELGGSPSKPQTREELVQEALANRAKAKKVFDDLSPQTRERIFSAVLGPDWKSQYEDDG